MAIPRDQSTAQICLDAIRNGASPSCYSKPFAEQWPELFLTHRQTNVARAIATIERLGAGGMIGKNDPVVVVASPRDAYAIIGRERGVGAPEIARVVEKVNENLRRQSAGVALTRAFGFR